MKYSGACKSSPSVASNDNDDNVGLVGLGLIIG